MTRESLDISALEARLVRLEEAQRQQQDLRAIEQLRYRYWYALLDKDVDEFVTCFTEDAFLEYGFDIELRGKEAIREFFADLLLAETLVRQVPRGTNPQLALVSETEARGRWLVEVAITRKQQEFGTRVSVQYDEVYRKAEDDWRVSYIKNEYLGFEQFTLKSDPF
jgi:uncharacterized protein (TIGR02246 family)